MKSYVLNGLPNSSYLAGVAETGDMVINNISGSLYFNRGTTSAPDWIEIDNIGGSGVTTDISSLLSTNVANAAANTVATVVQSETTHDSS